MMRARGQTVHLTTPFLKLLGIDPETSPFAFFRSTGALEEHPADPIGQNSWDRVSSASYRQVYGRTATIMHDLEERLGPATIERAFRAYYAKWHFRHPSIADFREVLAETSGDRATVEQVFRQNVYGAEPIDDLVENLTSIEDVPEPGTFYDGGKWTERTKDAIEKEIEQARAEWKKAHPDTKNGQGPFPYRTTVIARRDGAQIPETLVIRFEDGTQETAQWDDDRRWHRFIFVKPSKATSAELDPDHRVYLDHNKLNDGRLGEPDRSASRRWASDLAAVIEVAFSLLGAL
jgi:hypothetical protein